MNVDGAGEIFVRGLQVVSVNNGSGHYRPDARENLDYVLAILTGKATWLKQYYPTTDNDLGCFLFKVKFDSIVCKLS